MRDRLPVTARAACLLAVLAFSGRAAAAGGPADPALPKKLEDFDAYMQKVVKDWNVPGIGVGIVVKDELVFARGYGFRDYGKKLPFTPRTTVPIASNTKLFTAVAAGLLVEEGKLDWDKPVRQFVPAIQFYNDELNATVTIRDMLSHRTGITRHDSIWYKSDFTRKELFERLKYLEPSQPLRQTFLYNNMMYAGSGYVIELLSGQPWEDFVRERILAPLGMTSTVFSIDDMVKQPEHGVPFTERRDSFELHEIPYYREAAGIGPAGSINSSIEDMSKWLVALLNGGASGGQPVIPAGVLKATLAPAIALPNTQLEARGFGELLNPAYGTGRWTASYRGHAIAYHGGDINGFHSQVSLMPYDGIGAIVLVIGNHAAPLYNVVSYNVYERLLGLSLTPWSERMLDIRLKAKEAGKAARARAGGERVAGTKPSHPLDDYMGEFEHPAYGVLAISKQGDGLLFDFHKVKLALSHFHYDRFDTADDEEEGKWSVNFSTSPQGEVDKALVSLDEAEVSFVRRVPAALSAPATLRPYAGTYKTPTGAKFDVILKENGALGIVFPGQPFQALVPWKPHRFRVKEFADVIVEFVVSDGRVTEMRQIDPSGEQRFPRQ
ncbi:MAG: penicillin-binding protein [Acidobacteria bacterium]|nr:MAG: penicillin-binding protein [Acidobacteriota bacterium]